MELYLQCGWGMMEHCRSLIGDWGGGTVVLSPRDLEPDQLPRFAVQLQGNNGRVLLDPQFYLPHADHVRLVSHEYWPSDYESGAFWTGEDLRTLLGDLLALNRRLGCQQFILPGLYADRVDDDWLARQLAIQQEAQRLELGGLPLVATVALSADACRSADAIHAVLDAANAWPATSVYMVCEHPQGDYLVQDPVWLSNVMDLAAGIRLKRKACILGYCNHQMLIAGCTSATAVCSGTYMNVRSFPPEKFRQVYDEEIKQRGLWYYCPQALSEYTLPFLDIALVQGILGQMAPEPGLESHYTDILFSGPQPTTVGFAEPASFRHYLHCMSRQARIARADSFADTIAHHEQVLERAEVLLAQLQRAGVRGQMRDFAKVVDVGRAAIAVLRNTRGPTLTREWGQL